MMFLSRIARNGVSKVAARFRLAEIKAAALCTASESKESKININGQTINYVKVGSGSHTLLCFPGALGTIWSDFKPQVETLDRKAFTIVAWDPPGYGKSRPADRKFGMDFYERDADMAVKFMSEIGVNNFSVLGWSDGGISGLIMAAKNPQSLRKLVVWGANAYIIPAEVEAYEKLRDLSKWSDKMKAPLIEMYGEDGLKRMWDSWCDSMTGIYKTRQGNICKELVPKISCPTLVLHGDKDPMVANEHPKFLIENIKQSSAHHFPEGKHNIHLRYAKEFNDIITKFLTA